jgi:hypothetical protein
MATAHTAKHTFFYLLALVTLGFVATGLGQIIFQVINALFPEVAPSYDAYFSQETLRFGISAVIVGGPMYAVITHLINKELQTGEMRPDAGIRKWLTYLILFVSSLVIIGFLIGILNSFLSGELTIKFILKAFSAIFIAAQVFGYYLYDIRRERFSDQVPLRHFRIAFLICLVGALVGGFFVLDTPSTVRSQRQDQERINRLSNISWKVEEHYRSEEKLPSALSEIEDNLVKGHLLDPNTEEPFRYEVLTDEKYELCATFERSNREPIPGEISFVRSIDWLHEAGEHCFERTVEDFEGFIKPRPVR